MHFKFHLACVRACDSFNLPLGWVKHLVIVFVVVYFQCLKNMDGLTMLQRSN